MGLLFDVSENQIKAVNERLKSGGKEDVNLKDKNGNTGLHLACEKGLTDMVKLLVRYSARIDDKNNCPGWTPLHFAAYEGHVEIVEFLVHVAGAKPNVTDNQGDTPESWALEWENYKCAMILADGTKKWNEKQASNNKATGSSGGKGTTDEDDDDDEELMTHWVLPLPASAPLGQQPKPPEKSKKSSPELKVIRKTLFDNPVFDPVCVLVNPIIFIFSVKRVSG